VGLLCDLQTDATVPAVFKTDPVASGIQVHPSGRWLDASKRGLFSLIIFYFDPVHGLLSLVGFRPNLGVTSLCCALTASGELLLVGYQDSDQVVLFKLDPDSGLLSELPRQAMPKVGLPVLQPPLPVEASGTWLGRAGPISRASQRSVQG